MVETNGELTVLAVVAGGSGSGKSRFLYNKVVELIKEEGDKQGVFFFDEQPLSHINENVFKLLDGAPMKQWVYMQYAIQKEYIDAGLERIKEHLQANKPVVAFIDMYDKELKEYLITQLIKISEDYPLVPLEGVFSLQTPLTNSPKDGYEVYSGAYRMVEGGLTFVRE